MECITINDPKDRSFPLSRALFEDSQVLYHGSWSTYSSRIESEGFIHGALPFDWRHVATVFRARQAIGGSALRMFLGEEYPRKPPPCDLSLIANFWSARVYATDGGGEVIRMTIREAEQFERICAAPQERAALKNHWQKGLSDCPDHTATKAAVKLLGDDHALQHLCSEVKAAREALVSVTAGGCPAVYAIRVEPGWYGNKWATHLAHWEHGRRDVELRCSGNLIPPNRLLAKVIYPKGTDRDFMPTWCKTWGDVETLVCP